MEPHEYFYHLTYIEQLELLLRHGKHLGERMDGNIIRTVYRVNDYYVEVGHSMFFQAISGLFAFSDMGRLMPYADNLNLHSREQL